LVHPIPQRLIATMIGAVALLLWQPLAVADMTMAERTAGVDYDAQREHELTRLVVLMAPNQQLAPNARDTLIDSPEALADLLPQLDRYDRLALVHHPSHPHATAIATLLHQHQAQINAWRNARGAIEHFLLHDADVRHLRISDRKAESLIEYTWIDDVVQLGVAPGERIVLAEGSWRDIRIDFTATGTAQRPIVLRSAQPGQTTITGRSHLLMHGQHLVLADVIFRDGYPPLREQQAAGVTRRNWMHQENVITARGRHLRVTHCAIVNFNPPQQQHYYFWVFIDGQDIRLDHCYFGQANHIGDTVFVQVARRRPARARIDHNHFDGRGPTGTSSGETIRIGNSANRDDNAHCIVEYNLIERCEGDWETVGNKSSENIYRHNTFRNNAGHLSLRFGHRVRVEDNYFFGEGNPRAAGVRITGDDHVVIHNYFTGLSGAWGAALPIAAGTPGAPPGYMPVNNPLIAHNIFVDNDCPAINLGASAAADRTIPPRNITVTSNVFQNNQYLYREDIPAINTKWKGNLLSGPIARRGELPDGVTRSDAPLQLDDDELWRLPQHPPTRYKPLTPADLGPRWRR